MKIDSQLISLIGTMIQVKFIKNIFYISAHEMTYILLK